MKKLQPLLIHLLDLMFHMISLYLVKGCIIRRPLGALKKRYRVKSRYTLYFSTEVALARVLEHIILKQSGVITALFSYQ